jgi:exopolysaccharide biosynthesis predicted pyruvyltransferase EpsI
MPSATKDMLLDDVITLLSDEKMRKELSDFSRNTVTRHFPSSVIANDAISIYKKFYKAPRLCLLGYFGFSNLGDEQILRTSKYALKSRGIKELSVLKRGILSDNGEKEFNRNSPVQIIKALSASDALVLCGGNLLQNKTSFRSLLYYASIVILSRLLRRRLYLLSSGIGEINGALASAIVKESLKDYSFLGARTEYDKLMLSNLLKTDKRIALMPDFCFLLPQKAHTGKDIYFAIIASHAEFIKSLNVEKIAKETSLTPIGIIICKELDEKNVSFVYSEMNIDHYAPRSFTEACSLLEKCAFSICERLHGSIFSIISHTPTYLNDTSIKCAAFISEMEKRASDTGALNVVFSLKSDVKKIGAKNSDFEIIIDSLRSDIHDALDVAFTDPERFWSTS